MSLYSYNDIKKYTNTLEQILSKNNDYITSDEIKSLKQIILILAKEYPKNPIVVNKGDMSVWYCANCGGKIKSSDNYCCQCGCRVKYDDTLID